MTGRKHMHTVPAPRRTAGWAHTARSSIVLVLLLFVFSAACSGKPKQQGRPPAPVTVATVVEKGVPLQVRAIGNVEAYSTVSVKSQVNGVLSKVHFREGQDVNKGDLLFTIDPRPFEEALRQAEANLARDTAQLENARLERERYAALAEKGYVSQQEFDQARTAAAALEATVNADKAAVENARLQLSYCSIKSPITGRTGSILANAGNVIKANADTAMLVINQVQPIYVTFSVPEQTLPQIKTYMKRGKLTVEAVMQGEEGRPARGDLTFVDNAVDKSTGTITLKGTFPNTDRRLWPGQFVNVALTLAKEPNAVVVPSAALLSGQTGQYVFVVKDDQTVESRPVVVMRTAETETVIQSGLKPGEQVVTDGQLRLMPGGKVEIKPSAADSQREGNSKSQTPNPK